MKKLLCVLTCALLLSGLTGCGSKQSDDKLVVGMECNYAPFNWTNPKDVKTGVKLSDGSYCDGYDVKIAQELADKMDKELEIKKMEWDSLINALNQGDINAIIAGMTKNDEREKGADFTTPYYASEMTMIVRKGDALEKATSIQDFGGKTVAGQLGTNYDSIIDQIKDVNHAVPLADYPALTYALIQGTVDAITAELPVAIGVTEANPELTYITFEKGKGFEIDTTVSIGLTEGSRGSEEFEAIQKALDSISEEDRVQWMLDATNRQPATN